MILRWKVLASKRVGGKSAGIFEFGGREFFVNFNLLLFSGGFVKYYCTYSSFTCIFFISVVSAHLICDLDTITSDDANSTTTHYSKLKDLDSESQG